MDQTIFEVNLALRNEIESLKSSLNKLNSKVIKQEEEINRLKENEIKNVFRKTYEEMNNRSKLKARSEIQRVLNLINNSLSQKLNLQIFKVDLGIKVNSDPYKLVFIEHNEQKDEKDVDYYLYVKDRFNISDRTYQVIRKFYSDKIPSLDKIKEVRKEINKSLNIKKIENGFYTEPIQKIDFHINSFLKEKKFFVDNSVQVKLSADSTNISRNVKLVNFVFTIINEEKKACSVSGNYSIGIFRVDQESYETVSKWLSKIWSELVKHDSFKFEEKTIRIEYLIGSDWMMMSYMLGLYGPNSKFPCLWCEISSKDLHLVIEDDKQIKRSFSRQESIVKEKNKKEEHFGYKFYAVIKDIPHIKFVLDSLHLFLRISDVLFDLLINDIADSDKFTNSSIFNPEKHIGLNSFFEYLKKNKIHSYKKIVNNQTKTVSTVLSSLTGKPRWEIFKTIKIKKRFRSLYGKRKANLVGKIWSSFYGIMQYMKDCKSIDPIKIKMKTQKWIKLFCKVYHIKHVTPYMHAFANHLHQFYENGNLYYYNLEGLEKLNDLTTIEYFKSTNKRENATFQLLSKRCRIDIIAGKYGLNIY
jgi:hypothetical protein